METHLILIASVWLATGLGALAYKKWYIRNDSDVKQALSITLGGLFSWIAIIIYHEIYEDLSDDFTGTARGAGGSGETFEGSAGRDWASKEVDTDEYEYR